MVELPDTLKEKLHSCRTLPSIPTVVIEILDLCEREDVSISEIAKVLAFDPAITTKVLRIANSAFYGTRKEVTTLERAISIMGINSTLSLALSFSLVRNLQQSRKSGFDHKAYWRRSAVTATAAKALFELPNEMGEEELFLSGLLQDIGMLVLNEAAPEIYGSLTVSAEGRHNRLVELEMESLGTDHGSVGAWMLERWKLPENIMGSLAESHNPNLHVTENGPASNRILAAAGHIAEIWCNPDTAEATVCARKKAGDLLNLPDEKFKGLLGKIAASIPQITQNLDIDIGGEQETSRLLDQAREALVILNLQAQRQVNQMKSIAETDGLTLLYNRGYLEGVLPKLFDESVKSGRPLSVVFCDIDHFKTINDTYGHQAGDAILAMIAQILKSAMRASDIAARYGGEEFVCLLPGTPEEGAELVAERLRTAVCAALHKTEDGRKVQVYASFGCATFSQECRFKTAAELLEQADRCLYAAKRTGRNKVVTPRTVIFPGGDALAFGRRQEGGGKVAHAG